MSTEQLHVKLIRLTNIRGIKGTVEIPIGVGMTLVEGENGTGKSSRVSAIAVLADGDTTDLLHDGEDECEVYAELTDGTWFRRYVTRAGRNELTAGHPTMGKIGKAKAHLTSLIASAAMNPAEFLQADDVKAAEYVLKLAPLTVTRAEVEDAAGDLVDLDDVNVKGHALVVLDRVAKLLYDERTGQNRTAKDARTTVEQLKGSLPEDVLSPEESQQEVDRLTAEFDRLVDESASAREAARVEAGRKADTEIARLDDVVESLERQLATAKAERKSAIEAREAAQAAASEAAYAPFAEAVATVQREGAAAREALKHATSLAATVENTKKMIAAHEAKAADAHEQSQALTYAMAQVDALKAAKAADLPIKGVSIRDGRLYIGERPASRANTAERVRVALQVCVQQDTPVKFIAADSLESLDGKTRELLEKNARAKGIQIMAGLVSDGELAIRAPEGAVA